MSNQLLLISYVKLNLSSISNGPPMSYQLLLIDQPPILSIIVIILKELNLLRDLVLD